MHRRGPANKKTLALGRLKKGVMNRTETEYSQVLEDRKVKGEVLWWKFEGMKFKLGDNSFYTPDFAVMLASGEVQMHEVKGYWIGDARTKIKVVADLYPFQFIAITKHPNNKGGGWKVEEF
jgi:hypothetical protein